jgi:hypothetical protein
MVTEHFWRWSWIAHPNETKRQITNTRNYNGIEFKFYTPTPADTEQNQTHQQQLVQTAYDLGKIGIYTRDESIPKEYYIHLMYKDDSFKLKPGYITDKGEEIPHSDIPTGMGPVYVVSYDYRRRIDASRHIIHRNPRYS